MENQNEYLTPEQRKELAGQTERYFQDFIQSVRFMADKAECAQRTLCGLLFDDRFNDEEKHEVVKGAQSLIENNAFAEEIKKAEALAEIFDQIINGLEEIQGRKG